MFKKITKYYNNLLKRNQDQLVSKLNLYGHLIVFRNYMLEKQKQEILAELNIKTPDSPAMYGYKVYSQNDEDGIITYIFSKVPNQKIFIEIGCGNGLENNTHWLLLNGWKGVWVDGLPDNIQYIETNLNGLSFNDKLLVDQQFISLKNFMQLYQQYLTFLKAKEVDFFSIDIDGIDIYIIEHLLESGARPKVFCVEYNSKFPPPAELKVNYNDNHQWKYNDYMGASLQCWYNVMGKYGYIFGVL